MLLTPKSELTSRVSRFQTLLLTKGVQGAVIVQPVDLFYFSGTGQNAHLYIPAEGKPVLMVKKSYSRAQEESALEVIVPLPSVRKLPDVLTDLGYAVPDVLGLEMDVLPANSYLLYQQVFGRSKLVDVSGLIRQARQVKSAFELDLLRNSSRKSYEVFKEIPHLLKEGMADYELAAKIEEKGRFLGHMGHVFMRAGIAPFYGSIMSGWAAATPTGFDGPAGGTGVCPLFPIGAGAKIVNREEPILVDFGGIWDGYITDQSRTYAIGGLPAKYIRAYEISIKIQNAVIAKVKPGADGSDLFRLSAEIAAEAGLAENFMGYGPDQARFVAHGVGLELDELPVLANGLPVTFEPGMVFALEPKFVFPGEGVVGIENMFAVTQGGVEKLTYIPDDLVIV